MKQRKDSITRIRRFWSIGVVACVTAFASFAFLSPQTARTDKQVVSLAAHVPNIVKKSRKLGRVASTEQIQLAITLPLRNTEELDTFLRRVYDKHDNLYGQYLTTDEFTANYSPTEEDYNAVVEFAQANGLQITGTPSNRLLLDVSGSASAVEKAFGLHLNRYQAPNGRQYYAPDANPIIPGHLQGKVTGISGLNNYAVRRTHYIKRPANAVNPRGGNPHGSGPGGGLSPSDIRTAYNLNSVTATGAGQTIALFELDGYVASDITAYENKFNLPKVPLKNILVDGFNGSAGGGADEVTLDIELQIAMAPGVNSVLVYEGPNTSPGVLDTYNKIATDNLAKQISTSWGLAEEFDSPTELNTENSIFKQMAAQGQSIYAAAGDSGAFDNGSTISVDDPASQPFMTGVGGTKLSIKSDGTYISETTWGDSGSQSGGGGGISTIWDIPAYQVGVVSAASKGSTTKRNVPDVALDSDPSTGYSIFVGGQWNIFGGTSCASPLWAGFTALVNQQRAASNLQPLGFANPTLYTIGKSANYSIDFHDIADKSTNLFYPAVTGFDDATGWGTINGANLIKDMSGAVDLPAPKSLKAVKGDLKVDLTWLASKGATGYNIYRGVASGQETLLTTNVSTLAYTDKSVVSGITYYYKVTAITSTSESGFSNEASATPSGTVKAQLLGNPGFENGTKSAPWVASAGVIDNSSSQAAHGGKWKAWMCGYGTTHTDSVMQQVIIPSTAVAGSLSFWLHIDSAELSSAGVKDTLVVQIRDASGTVLNTLGTYSNVNAKGGFVKVVFDMSPYIGKTVQVYLLASENGSKQTSFVVDDFALNVQ